jgi:hypothetical protein
MKPTGIFVLSAMLILALNAWGQGSKSAAEAQPSQPQPTIASNVDRRDQRSRKTDGGSCRSHAGR